MVVAPAGPAAADDDLFTVRAVAVDATADTARLARDRAIAEGRRAAFQRLVERLVPASRARAVTAPTDAELERMVIGFEVADERTSSVRWLADLTVAFDPAAVRARLRAAGVPFAETRSLPVLVIPLYDTGGETVLWREPNPWRNAWYELAPQGGLVPFVGPYGDVSDIRDLVSHLKHRGIGVLITDHNVREALEIVDRAYILHEGVVLMEGPPAEIVAHEGVRRVYLGERFSL
jgi:hypothetical protein